MPVKIQSLKMRSPFVALGRFVVWSKWSKIGLQQFRILSKFDVWMRSTGLFRISENEVYASNMSPVLSGGSRVQSVRFKIQFLGSRWPFVALGLFVV